MAEIKKTLVQKLLAALDEINSQINLFNITKSKSRQCGYMGFAKETLCEIHTWVIPFNDSLMKKIESIKLNLDSIDKELNVYESKIQECKKRKANTLSE